MTRALYEITLYSGDAEAIVLCEASSPEEAEEHAKDRAAANEVAWEGDPDDTICHVEVAVYDEGIIEDEPPEPNYILQSGKIVPERD